MSPAERKARARAAAHTRWSKCDDRVAATEPARAAALERFARQVDPDGLLDPRERRVRAEHARRAWMATLVLRRHQIDN